MRQRPMRRAALQRVQHMLCARLPAAAVCGKPSAQGLRRRRAPCTSSAARGPRRRRRRSGTCPAWSAWWQPGRAARARTPRTPRRRARAAACRRTARAPGLSAAHRRPSGTVRIRLGSGGRRRAPSFAATMAGLLCAAAMRVAGERRDGAAGAARPAARWAGARCVESQARLFVLGGEQVVGQLQRLGRLLVLGELDQHVVVVRLALADGRVQRNRDLRAWAQRSRAALAALVQPRLSEANPRPCSSAALQVMRLACALCPQRCAAHRQARSSTIWWGAGVLGKRTSVCGVLFLGSTNSRMMESYWILKSCACSRRARAPGLSRAAHPRGRI